MKQKLLFLCLFVFLAFSNAMAQCDPWITKAYQELYKRNPSSAECNIRNYNNGSWNSYNDLVSYIKTYNNSKSGSSTSVAVKSTLQGDPWIFKAYRELFNREPNAGELNTKNYNGGSWGSYDELKNLVRQFRANLSKYGVDLKIKDLGTGFLLVGYTSNNKITALNLVQADGGKVVASGGANVVAAGGANVVAAGGMNLRDIIANFIRDNGGMVIAPGGGNLLNLNNANLTPSQIMSGIQNIAGAGFGGSFRIAAAGEAIIPTSGSGAIIFK